MTAYLTLREANVARQLEWDPGNQAANNDWRMNELAGETGEVCNILKKLHRERVNVPGSRATKDDLAEELADVLICLDLLLMTSNFPASKPRHAGILVERSLTALGHILFRDVGRLLDAIDKTDINVLVALDMADHVHSVCADIAAKERIDIRMAVGMKFNATSRKMSLRTMLYNAL